MAIRCSTSIIFLFLLMVSMKTFAATSFENALKRIITKSTRLEKTRQQKEASYDRYLSSQMNFLPDINLSGSYLDNSRLEDKQKSVSAGIELNLFKSFSDYHLLKANESETEALETKYLRDYLQVENEAAKALLDYIHALYQLDVQKSLLNIRKEIHRVAKGRYERGLTPEHEVTKAQVDMANARSSLADQRETLQTVRARVEALLNRKSDPPDIKKFWPWKSFLLSPKADALLEKDLPPEKRYGVTYQRYLFKQQKKLAMQNYSNIFPRLDFSLDRERNDFNGNSTQATVATLTLSVPLFSGLRDWSSYKTAIARARVQGQELESQLRQARSELRQRKDNFRTTLKTARQREKTLILARKLYQTNFERFEAGRVGLNDLSIDQDRLFQTESLAARGWRDVHVALVSLCQVLNKRIKSCLN